jgi:hypothetical protein
VSSHWKSQITTGMIHFGSLLASLFFIFPFRGCGLRAAGKLYFAKARAFLLLTYQSNSSVLWFGWKVFLIKLTQPRGGAEVDSVVSFLWVSSSNPCYGKLFLQHLVSNSRKQAVSRSLLRKVLQQNINPTDQQNINTTDQQNISKINSEW